MVQFAHSMRRRSAMQAALHRVRQKNASSIVITADLAAFATGSISFAANPANSSTITLGGTVITFGSTVAIGANLAATLVTLLAFVNGSADANISKCTYSVVGSALLIKFKSAGVATFTLAASAATRSGATLVLPTIRKRKAL